MNKVTITFVNNAVEITSVKNAEVGKKYVDAIKTVFTHDGLMDTISRIDMIDMEDGKIDVLYQKDKDNAKSTNICNTGCTSARCDHHPDLLESNHR